MIRVGLIGYGLAGAVFHEPLIRACDALELTAVLTSRDHPLKVGSIEDLFERADLVVIASPNQTHFELAKSALQAAKHVIVDKPFTITIEEADELIRISKQSEHILSVFQNRRWDGDFLTVKRIVPKLGGVLLFEANWDRFRPTPKRGWREEPAPGAGLFNDLGPHLIDQTLRLFGIPESVDADIGIQRDGAKVDDYFDVTLHYGAMRACLRSSSVAAEPRPRFAAHGARVRSLRRDLIRRKRSSRRAFSRATPNTATTRRTERSPEPTEASRACRRNAAIISPFMMALRRQSSKEHQAPSRPKDARDALLLIDLARRASALGQLVPVPAASSTGE